LGPADDVRYGRLRNPNALIPIPQCDSTIDASTRKVVGRSLDGKVVTVIVGIDMRRRACK